MKYILLLQSFMLATLLLFAPKAVVSQNYPLIDRPERLALFEKAVGFIYNAQFEQVDSMQKKIELVLPDHPATTFTKAIKALWEQIPPDYSSQQFKTHFALLEKTVSQGTALMDKNKEDIEGVFFTMAAKSLMMQHYADMGEKMKAVGQAKDVYKLVKKGFEMKESFKEFYFTTGIYNYFRVAYPEKHPLYKPFAIFFDSGDKALGLEQLHFAAKNTTFTSTEALNYLAFIYTQYENDTEKALQCTRQLHQRYPKNIFFVSEHAKALVLAANYKQAAPLIKKLLAHKKDLYFPMMGHTLQAIVDDLYYGNQTTSYQHLYQAKEIAEKIGHRSYRVKAMIYGSLSNYYRKKGQPDTAREYYKKAKDFDEENFLSRIDKP